MDRIERRLSSVPTLIAGYRGADSRFDRGVDAVLDTDDALVRVYAKSATDVQGVYVGYYGTAKGGRTGHLPIYCFPGSGYRIVRSSTERIPLAGGTSAAVNRVVVERDGVRLSCLYWFQSRLEIHDTGWGLNWKRFRDRLRDGTDDGAFVRLLTPIRSTEAEALARQETLAADLIPRLAAAWPVEHVAPSPLRRLKLRLAASVSGRLPF